MPRRPTVIIVSKSMLVRGLELEDAKAATFIGGTGGSYTAGPGQVKIGIIV